MPKNVYVRIQPKATANSFYRCGFGFTREWQSVEVDEATLVRLSSEQMLEVSEAAPVEEQTLAGTGDNKAPEDQELRQAAIISAINNLDKEDSSCWTRGGLPKTEAIEALTGWQISASERDTAWKTIMEHSGDQ